MSEELKSMQSVQYKSQNADQLAYEINFIKRQTLKTVLAASVQIGERLSAAKELVPHGQWSEWLKEKVDYSQSTADNLMRIYKEYGDEQISLSGKSKFQTFANLTYSQAVALFALPEHQREKFVEQNNVSEMTTKELKEAIAAKKAAEEAKEKAETELAGAQNEINDMSNTCDLLSQERDDARALSDRLQRQIETVQNANANLTENANRISKQRDKAEKKAERLQKKLDELSAKMQELSSAPAEISEEEREIIRAEIERKYSGKIEQLALDAETARQQAKIIAEEKAALEAKAAQKVSDSMIKLNVLFEQTQSTLLDMQKLINACPDEQRDKLNKLIHETLSAIFN